MWKSGVPGKLSPEINPSSVIGSVIKLLPLCITPPHTSTQSPSLPSHTLHCATAGTWRAAKLEGEKNRFCYCPTWELLPLLYAVATQPCFIPGADTAAALPGICTAKRFEETPSLCSALPLVRQTLLHELTFPLVLHSAPLSAALYQLSFMLV